VNVTQITLFDFAALVVLAATCLILQFVQKQTG